MSERTRQRGTATQGEQRGKYMPKAELSGNTGTEPERKTSSNKKGESPEKATCYGCGQEGHIARDPKCPKYKTGKGTAMQMYAAREIVHKEDDPAKGQDNESAKEENTGDNKDPYGGSQYSSGVLDTPPQVYVNSHWTPCTICRLYIDYT